MARERDHEPDRHRPWPIKDYGAIGDKASIALVAPDGGIDFCCLPRFDDDAVFCRLLDVEHGGTFRVGPAGRFSLRRGWLGDSNVLVSEYRVNGGVFRLTEFMPLRRTHEPARILRRLEGVEGSVEVAVTLKPTFGFARHRASLEATSEGGVATSEDGSLLRLLCPFPTRHEGGVLAAAGRLVAGDVRWVNLLHGASGLPDPVEPDEAERLLERTRSDWEAWCARGRYGSERPALLRRSALALQLLTDSGTGALVAAGTTSLPEEIGGSRNWDYRYTWIRDAVWSLDALMRLGYHEEAMAFWRWLGRHVHGEAENLGIVYRSNGHEVPEEMDLRHLAGYQGSRPVRVGNAARTQRQLDVYGTTIDGIFRSSKGMPDMRPLPEELWPTVIRLANLIVREWRTPGRGMWEQRNGDDRFTASEIWCWAGLDRAITLARRDRLDVSIERWERTRRQIREAVLTRAWSPERGCFMRTLDGRDLDASVLFVALTGMLPPDDPRIASTVDVLRRELTIDGFLQRYDAADGCEGDEGAFLLANFWLVTVLASMGRKDEARELLDRIVALPGPTGLFAEEVEIGSGDFLGNYPQAFTHLGLVQAVLSLEDR